MTDATDAPQEQPQATSLTFQTTSQIAQDANLKEFLEKQLTDPFNKYCIDCKKNTTTHALVWYGVYVCADCAAQHKSIFGQHNVYVKDVYGEQWDDYQLRSLTLGGNKKLFEILKEYKCEIMPLDQKYKQSCAAWYKKRHLTLMNDETWDQEANPQPPRDFEERKQYMLGSVKSGLGQVGQGLQFFGSTAKSTLGAAGATVVEHGGNISSRVVPGVQSGAQKVQSGAMNVKGTLSAGIGSFFKKKAEPEAAASEEQKPEEEEKKEEAK